MQCVWSHMRNNFFIQLLLWKAQLKCLPQIIILLYVFVDAHWIVVYLQIAPFFLYCLRIHLFIFFLTTCFAQNKNQNKVFSYQLTWYSISKFNTATISYPIALFECVTFLISYNKQETLTTSLCRTFLKLSRKFVKKRQIRNY